MAETILWLLENGKWHNLSDIEEKTQLSGHKVKNVTNFLAEYNLVKLDKTGHKVKLDSPTRRFLDKIRELENEEIH
jgi:hypothetical protein